MKNQKTKQLPKNWNQEFLRDVLETLESGGRPKGGSKKEGIPSLGGEHLNYDGGFNFEKMKFIPEDHFNSITRGKIKKEDVLIVKDGATTGKTSFVDDKFPYEKAAVNEHVFIARPNSKIYPKYLFYSLYSGEGQEQLKKAITGSAQGGINFSILDKIQVSYPQSKELQKQIVQAIESNFSKIDNATQNLKTLKNKIQLYRKAVLKKAFEGGLLERRELKETSINGIKTKIPLDWKVEKFDDYAYLQGGYAFKSKDYVKKGVPLVKIANVYSGNVDWSEKTFISKEEYDSRPEFQLRRGDLVMAMTRPIIKSLQNIKTAIIREEDLPCSLNQRVGRFKVRDEDKLMRDYLLYYIFTIFFKSRVIKEASSTNQPNISSKKIKEFDIPLPESLKTQQSIVQDIESKFSVLDKVEEAVDKALTKAEKLKKSILKSAFEGKLIKD